MPALGMAQETGRIVQWLKAGGESVRQGEPLLEIETDKSVMQLDAPAGGVLRIVRDVDDEGVPIGEVIGWIVAEGEEPPELTAGRAQGAAPQAAAAAAVAVDAAAAQAPGPTGAAEGPAAGRAGPPMSPKARRLARERGVDVRALAQGGEPLHAADILRAGAQAPAAPAGGRLRRWNGVGEAMASRTARSWRQAPHFYLMREVDAGGLTAWLAAVRRRLPDATLTDLLVTVVARALARFPHLNASPAEGGALEHDEINIGLAVATERGLLVPVIHAADKLGLPAVVEERRALLARTRDGRATPGDLGGSTFTISNLGMFGVDQFIPVLNLDEALLLAVGRIREKVVVDDGRIVARPIMALTLACDHRVVDGAAAAEFLREVAAILEQPVALLD